MKLTTLMLFSAALAFTGCSSDDGSETQGDGGTIQSPGEGDERDGVSSGDGDGDPCDNCGQTCKDLEETCEETCVQVGYCEPDCTYDYASCYEDNCENC